MKRRISPVLLVLILIVLVAAAGIGTALIRRYMPSGEKMDGSEYFSLNDSSEAALVVNRELKEEKAKIIDGRYYIENTVVGEYCAEYGLCDSPAGRGFLLSGSGVYSAVYGYGIPDI